MFLSELDELGCEIFRPQDVPGTGQRTAQKNEGLNPTSHEPLDSTDRVPAFFPYKDNQRLDLRVCRLRRFFISHNNYMGLAPADVPRGDLICILFGCSVPVVL
jgi:hypothetical protein